jgi:hypothetical protein
MYDLEEKEFGAAGMYDLEEKEFVRIIFVHISGPLLKLHEGFR